MEIGRWNRVGRYGVIVFFLIGALCCRTFSNEMGCLFSGEPYALGVGQAYAALASGPLAPLWNAAGCDEMSGLQGALAFCLLPDKSMLFYAGGTVAAAGGPVVSWTTVRHAGEEGAILGAFSYPLCAGMRIGGSLAYLFGRDGASVSFNGGATWRGEYLWLGASGFGLESIIAEGKRPSRVLLGAVLRVFPWMRVALDLNFCSPKAEVALGAEASVRGLVVRWGSALSLDGRLAHLGLGLGFDLLGFPIDIGVGLMGSELQLAYSLGVTAILPIQW
jgi:hypothetical protein